MGFVPAFFALAVNGSLLKGPLRRRQAQEALKDASYWSAAAPLFEAELKGIANEPPKDG